MFLPPHPYSQLLPLCTSLILLSKLQLEEGRTVTALYFKEKRAYPARPWHQHHKLAGKGQADTSMTLHFLCVLSLGQAEAACFVPGCL